MHCTLFPEFLCPFLENLICFLVFIICLLSPSPTSTHSSSISAACKSYLFISPWAVTVHLVQRFISLLSFFQSSLLLTTLRSVAQFKSTFSPILLNPCYSGWGESKLSPNSKVKEIWKKKCFALVVFDGYTFDRFQ